MMTDVISPLDSDRGGNERGDDDVDDSDAANNEDRDRDHVPGREVSTQIPRGCSQPHDRSSCSCVLTGIGAMEKTFVHVNDDHANIK